jgi:hypothetical protein
MSQAGQNVEYPAKRLELLLNYLKSASAALMGK